MTPALAPLELLRNDSTEGDASIASAPYRKTRQPVKMTFEAHADDWTCINTIRTLSLDVVNKANSGHPGAPMGMAPVAHILWSRFMRCNPKSSHWPNRDRFVLSNGHACALQYVLLHLLGYKLSMDDLKSFRQVDSTCNGHPEVHHTDGVEVTTGPLGQGFGNAVGLAMAQAQVGATFNKDGFSLFDNYTYMFTGDGCLQEGVASEAASLAGHLQLGNLIAIYDSNKITIDGDTAVSFTEDVTKRMEAYGWHCQTVEQGDDDLEGMYSAILAAQQVKDKPSFITLKTTIGFGSKLQGTHGVHGNPLKPDDTEAIKKKFGFDPAAKFAIPDATKTAYAKIGERGAKLESDWTELLSKYTEKFSAEGKDLERRLAGKLPDGWEKCLPVYSQKDDAIASRKLSETVITKLADAVPEFVCGSADLTGSNLTRWKTATDFQPPSTGLGSYAGRYMRYGIREHGMGAIANGMAAYGGNLILPAISTFANFTSYAAGAIRLSALSGFRVIWVATHDSIGLGEDGPTHQPIEVAAHFRALPNMHVWRPADGNETSAAYLMAMMNATTPSMLLLTRQNLPQLENSTIAHATKGGYVVHDTDGETDLTYVSTGSEVSICMEAAKILMDKGVKVRVVSLPCFEIFAAQPKDYRMSILPDGHPVLSVEAYSTVSWGALAHEHYGMSTFGASGPYKDVYKKFGFTGENIASVGEKVIAFWKGKTILSPQNTCLVAI
ncbi:uncharacterized protein L969DRAFT_97334 [Mixia osmundae IAM 14324]|uniref:transketolase n=1 Tax=Mixia osmundae (strain CBS 9802 / IAM 14324 / JCM 22182 / KY 12970) TaxID=764103 RepID=G7DV49_MIXOS|nr:uncharacterized protein L969DRAFT_97334 [Mixia osmundae IAM 14324]KEI36324.1 hypothetical protein L969DRAFT_97334 [Mixia osmundae IAM 14324]GAA94459.1 hypothetical protein E5Q_01111 [Mixia osmundae IAM 14324]